MPTLGRLFWVALRRSWPRWRDALILVKPETVVRWHRLGFRAYWTWKSKKRRPGRPRIDPELRKLIRRLAEDNPTWGAPRVHAELRLLEFDVAERTVLRYLPKPANPDAVGRWIVLLRQHRKALVGMDFLVVHTLTFRLLHVLFIVHRERRRIVHWAVTRAPNLDWIRQQLRQLVVLERPASAGVARNGDHQVMRFEARLRSLWQTNSSRPHPAGQPGWADRAPDHQETLS